MEESTTSIEDRVRTALDMVIDDIKRSGHRPRPSGVVAPTNLPSSGDAREEEVRYGGHTFPVAPETTLADIVVDIAFRLQDDVMDDAGAGWPMSTDGKRLLVPGVSEEGDAYWYDGESGVAPVGGLFV